MGEVKDVSDEMRALGDSKEIREKMYGVVDGFLPDGWDKLTLTIKECDGILQGLSTHDIWRIAHLLVQHEKGIEYPGDNMLIVKLATYLGFYVEDGRLVLNHE